MLKKLRIQNFKVWEDTGEIDLAPITLFFGANSSGKSSIGQFLIMLKQTVESRGRDVFHLGDRYSAVQLGSYREMVFQRDTKKDIGFEYQWSLRESLTVINPNPPHERFSGKDLAFQAEVSTGDIKDYVKLFKYRLIRDGEKQLLLGMAQWPGTRSYKVESPDLTLKKRSEQVEELYRGLPDRFYRFPHALIMRYLNGDILREFNHKHEELFNTLFYLGPLRSKTARSYDNAGGTPESVGYEGEDTVAAILAAKDKERFERGIASKLKYIGLIEDFKVEKLVDRLYKVLVRTKGSITWVELPDVGFGISQVLPVLVQFDYAPEGSIILIDQPEVHLHPYAQSALADVMIDVIKERNIQLIIETHSEHFLRRLQRRIAEDRLSQDKVSVYFSNINNTVPLVAVPNITQVMRNRLEDAGISSANELVRMPRRLREVPGIGEATAKKLEEIAQENIKAKAGAKLEPLDIDEFGNIRNWPENFFGDEMGDITAQARAAMEKRMQKQTPNLER